MTSWNARRAHIKPQINSISLDRPIWLRAPTSLAAVLVMGVAARVTPFAPTDAGAVGFRLPNQDPEGIARGNAFVATADNPSAIYYNPAGITQLEGHNFRVGLYLISAGTEYTSPTGQKAETDSDFQPVPQIYYVFSPKDSDFSFGLGVYAPYGLSLDWGDNPPFRPLAQEGELLYATLNPVVAWQLYPTLSLAIGPTINYSDATLKRGIGLVAGDQFKVEGDGVAYGFNAGIRWQPHHQWAFGLNYRSATTVDYDGESSTTPNPPFSPKTPSTSASIRFPQFIDVGVSYRPTELWNFEVNLDWTDWEDLDEIVFKGTVFGNVPFVLNYESSFMYEFGVTRQLGRGYAASVGYIFSENSSPDRNFNPIVPDSDLHLGSIGVSHRGKRWDWAAGYHFAYNGGREVTGSQPGLADGRYETLNHAFNFSVTFKF
jgi:long-chain fatty acid transport protein